MQLSENDPNPPISPEELHPSEYYEYELAGVVVQVGTAEAGHYYSFIRDRENDGDKWYEFNDSTVRTFRAEELELQCFGGKQEVTEIDEYGYAFTSNMEQNRNAYLLIYERVKPVLHLDVSETPTEPMELLQVEVTEQKSAIPIMLATSFISRLRSAVREKDKSGGLISKAIPPRIYHTIWEDNMQFLFDRLTFYIFLFFM